VRRLNGPDASGAPASPTVRRGRPTPRVARTTALGRHPPRSSSRARCSGGNGGRAVRSAGGRGSPRRPPGGFWGAAGGGGGSEAPATVQRDEHAGVGDLLHVDTKKLGRVTHVGHRITGDRRHRPRGAGWEFVHVAVDDYSRVAYVELLPDERSESVRGFIRRALAWFRARGVRVRRVLTDNGS